MTAEGGGNGGESLGEEKKNSLVEGEEKERGWNLVRVRMERDYRKICHHEGWEMTGWQYGRGGEAEDDGIGTG